MPEISRFCGIIIRMFAEPEAQHHVPHFHAHYQENVAVYAIDPVVHLAGELPKRQQRLVEAWAEMHQGELLEDWRRLEQGQEPAPIVPLQ